MFRHRKGSRQKRKLSPLLLLAQHCVAETFCYSRARMAFDSFRDFVNALDLADSRLRETWKGIYLAHGRD